MFKVFIVCLLQDNNHSLPGILTAMSVFAVKPILIVHGAEQDG